MMLSLALERAFQSAGQGVGGCHRTPDQHQQNPALALAVVIVDGKSNAHPGMLPFTPFLRCLSASSFERALDVVEDGGNVLTLGKPRVS